MVTPRTAIYVRHSPGMQNHALDPDQVAAFSAIVASLGGEVIEIYLDRELSGLQSDRPALRRMLSDVRKGQIDMVVAEGLDRLARHTADLARIRETLSSYSVQIHTMTEGLIDEARQSGSGQLS